MLDCRAIPTRMVSNLNILIDASSKSIDATMYHQMIISLMYLMITRLDICFAVNTVIQFLTNLRHVHLIDSKHVPRYLKGTVYYRLKYDANQKINLHDYVDSYWAGSSIERKSTSGCCFSFGSGMIPWFSRKQSFMELSTIESKYVFNYLASCEKVWLRK